MKRHSSAPSPRTLIRRLRQAPAIRFATVDVALSAIA
jgi:hypothetical protein